MSEYIINLFLAAAGFFVLLSMSAIIIHLTLSHKNRFTGPMSTFYHRLGIFFIALFAIQALFPFYMLMINILRIYGHVPLPDTTNIFFERMYLSLFILINIFSFYLGFKVLESMGSLADNYSFAGKKAPSAKEKITSIYFSPRKREK